jgi:hypothetical protein
MGVHLVKIRITKAFSGYRIGQEFDWADGMARIYVGRGMAEEIIDTPTGASMVSVERTAPDSDDTVEEATASPRVERATMPSKRRQAK